MSFDKIVDLALDGTEGDTAVIIDGVRLPVADYWTAQRVFHKLVAMRNEIQSMRKWRDDTIDYLAHRPLPPKQEV